MKSLHFYRYSPHIEDELPHELSTITEVDTPGTSRLNAVDVTNANESSMAPRTSIGRLESDAEALKLLYNAFPKYKDYIKSNSNVSQLSTTSVNETNDMTGGQTLSDDKLAQMLEPHGSKVDELKYKTFDGEDQRPQMDSNCENELHMSYKKFPSHAEYAKSVPGLLDSQSIDQMQISDANDENSNSISSLPDIINELKNRNILEHSFGEAADGNGELDDLLLVRGNATNVSAQTTETCKGNESLSDTLENELTKMGLGWVTAELKKSKAQPGNSSSMSSDTSNHAEPRQLLNRQSPPTKKTSKRSYQKMSQSRATNDSFVDKNLLMSKIATESGKISTQPSDVDTVGQSINLKDFLARELLKHSSVSSSSDSSMASMFLKSFLGQSSRISPETPQSRGRDKHRTSTPVDHSKVDSSSTDNRNDSKKGIHSSSSTRDLNKNEAATHTFFSNDSQQLSSVRLSTTDSQSTSTSTFSEDKQK